MPHIGVQPIPQATWRRPFGKTQNITDTIAVPYGYTVGYLRVEIEGRALNPDEYTADDGMVVTFSESLPAGTNWAFEIITPFQAADHYTKGESDARYTRVLQRVFKQDNTRRLFTGAIDTWRGDYTGLNSSIAPLSNDSKLRVKVDLKYHGLNGSVFVRILRNGIVDPLLNGNGGVNNCFAHVRTDAATSVGNYQTSVGTLNVLIPHDGTIQDFVLEHRVQTDGRFTVNRDGAAQTDGSQGSHSPTLISTMEIEEVI